MDSIKEEVNVMLQHKKDVIICGCGRFGSSIASALSNHKYNVKIIDLCEASFFKLQEDFSGFELLGDASDLEVLEDAGIQRCDMVLATTDNDNVNAMIAQIAAFIYHVKEVYIRLNDPAKETLLEDSSIHAIYPARLSIQEFERLSSLHLQAGKERTL